MPPIPSRRLRTQPPRPFRLSSFVPRLSSFVFRLSSFVFRLSSLVSRLSSFVSRLSSFVFRLFLPALAILPACSKPNSGPVSVPANATQAATVPGQDFTIVTGTNPTSQAALTEPSDADIQPVPALDGRGILTRMPDGQLWARFPNGMAYQDIKSGASMQPQPGQTVYIFYKIYNATTGDLIDETQPGKPFGFRLGTRSQPLGLSIALYSMDRGAIMRWWIPPELAFGDKGIPGKLPPNTPVIYRIELQQWDGSPVKTLNLRPPEEIGPSRYLSGLPTTQPAGAHAPLPAPQAGPPRP